MSNYTTPFEDVNLSSTESIPAAQVKTSPSVNAPNDGSFNSEENLKWANRKLAQKTFIVGNDQNDTRNSFRVIENNGDSLKISSGKVSIDGYLIKISNPENISYDKELVSGEGMSVDIKHINKFIQELTSQPNSTVASINDFVFSEYTIDYDSTAVNTSWAYAAVNHIPIGFVKETYTGDIKDGITVVTHTITLPSLKFGSNEIEGGFEPESLDDLVGRTEPLAVINADSYDVYYPVFIESRSIYDETTKQYHPEYFICYTDIFSIWHYLDTPEVQSRTYLTTECLDCDITDNKPLETVDFSSCITDSYSGKIYDPDYLYYNHTKRYTKSGIESGSETGFENPEDHVYNVPKSDSLPFGVFSSIFDVYSVSDLAQNIPAQSDIYEVDNNISYFCIKDSDIPSSYKQTYNEQTIPVCFMTSDGRLCPDGFMYLDSSGNRKTISTYPVEGYLHWAKRMYLIYYAGQVDITEADIQAVTVEQLCAWDSGEKKFSDIYGVIMKYVSLYMQITYSSLYDNVLKIDQSSDTNNIKFNGCGTALSAVNSAQITSGDFDVTLQYTSEGIIKSGNSYSSHDFNKTTTYHKDMNSDHARVVQRIDRTAESKEIIASSVATDSCDYKCYYEDIITEVSYGGNDYNVTMIGIEDPINYIKRCCLTTTAQDTDEYDYYNSHRIKVQDNKIKVFKIVETEGIREVLAAVTESYGLGNINAIVRNLVIDDYLMPMVVPSDIRYRNSAISNLEADEFDIWLGTKKQYSDNTMSNTKSLINGMNFCWRQYCWRLCMPYVMNTQYDSLGYLRGRSIEDVTQYKGLRLFFKFQMDTTNDDFILFNLIFSSIPTNTNFDKESCVVEDDVLFEESQQRRETYVHSSKIFDYDDDQNKPSDNSDSYLLPKLLYCGSVLSGNYTLADETEIMEYCRAQDKSLLARTYNSASFWNGSQNISFKNSTTIPSTYKVFIKTAIIPKVVKLGYHDTFTQSDDKVYLLEDHPNLVICSGTVSVVDSSTHQYIDSLGKMYDLQGNQVGTINYNTGVITWSPTSITVSTVSYSTMLVCKDQGSGNLEVSTYCANPARVPMLVPKEIKNTAVNVNFKWTTWEQNVQSVNTYEDLPATPDEGDGAVYLVLSNIVQGANYDNSLYKYSSASSSWNLIPIPQNCYVSIMVFGVDETKLPDYINRVYDSII